MPCSFSHDSVQHRYDVQDHYDSLTERCIIHNVETPTYELSGFRLISNMVSMSHTIYYIKMQAISKATTL